MSNLGDYQWFTTLAKKNGGVKPFLDLLESEAAQKALAKGIKTGKKRGFVKGSVYGSVGTAIVGILAAGIYYFVSSKGNKPNEDLTGSSDNLDDERNRPQPIFGPFHFHENISIDNKSYSSADDFWVAGKDGDIILIFFQTDSDNILYLDKDYLYEKTNFTDIEIPKFE